MGSLGRTLTTGQKWLRGKMVNLITVGSIKKASAVHNKQKQGGTTGNIEKQRNRKQRKQRR